MHKAREVGDREIGESNASTQGGWQATRRKRGTIEAGYKVRHDAHTS